MPGYIYAITAPDLDFVKIGKSATQQGVRGRFAVCQTGSPVELFIHSIREHENYHTVETKLHRRFASAWVRGEWFDLTNPKVNVWLEDRLKNGYGYKESVRRYNGGGGRTPAKIMSARIFIRRFLESRPNQEALANDVTESCIAEGFSKRTAESAKKELGIKSIKIGNQWWWILP